MRKTGEELEQIKKKYGIKELYSYSKLDCWRTSKYEFFLKYIKHEKPLADRDSAYSVLGGICHSILEDMYNGKIEPDEMKYIFHDEFTQQVDMFGVKFDRKDSDKNKNIQTKYQEDIRHFFTTYQKLPYSVITELFLLTKINDDIYIQGYADAIFKDEEGNYIVTDWKTSTIYSKGESLNQHSHQLAIYCEALRQKGVPKEKIKACFCFLKYVKVRYQQVNGKCKEFYVERRQIGEKLQNRAKTWLKKEDGITDEEIEQYLNDMFMMNTLRFLPESVKEKFEIEDAYVYVDEPFEIFEEFRTEAIQIVNDIDEAREEYEATGSEDKFWDDEESLKKQSYYLANLMDYAIPQHKPYAEYLDKIQKEKDESDDLLGVRHEVQKKTNEVEEAFDMSWLNDV